MNNTLQQRTAPEAVEAVVVLETPEQALSVITEGREDLLAALNAPEEVNAPNKGNHAPSSGDDAFAGVDFDSLVGDLLAAAA